MRFQNMRYINYIDGTCNFSEDFVALLNMWLNFLLQNFECYGPDFTLHFTAGNRPNENLHKAVEELMQTISGYLYNVQTQ